MRSCVACSYLGLNVSAEAQTANCSTGTHIRTPHACQHSRLSLSPLKTTDLLYFMGKVVNMNLWQAPHVSCSPQIIFPLPAIIRFYLEGNKILDLFCCYFSHLAYFPGTLYISGIAGILWGLLLWHLLLAFFLLVKMNVYDLAYSAFPPDCKLNDLNTNEKYL